MKKLLLILILVLPLMSTKAQDHYVVDPDASVRSVSGSFNAVKISDGIDLYLSQSAPPGMAVSASSASLKQGIKTEVENNTLHIYFDGEKTFKKNQRKLRVYLAVTGLNKIEVSGASDVIVAGNLTADHLYLKMMGASDFKGAVKVTDLTVNLSGASDVKISGTASNADITNSGASDLLGFDLVTDHCNIKASGASDISITVNKEMTVNAAGASTVKYKGSPVIKEERVTGSSTVRRKNR